MKDQQTLVPERKLCFSHESALLDEQIGIFYALSDTTRTMRSFFDDEHVN